MLPMSSRPNDQTPNAGQARTMSRVDSSSGETRRTSSMVAARTNFMQPPSISDGSRALATRMPLVLQLLLGVPQIHRHLRVEPELGRRLQHLGEEERRLGGEGTATVDDSVDQLDVDAHLLGQRELRQLHGLEPFLQQDLARRRGGSVGWQSHGALLPQRW